MSDPTQAPTQAELEAAQSVRVNPAVRFSVGRYVLSIGFFAAVVIMGLVASLGLGVDRLPSFDVPIVSVSTTYTGATPENIEQQVSRVVEDAVSTIGGVTDISSTNGSGVSQVTISFADGTDVDSAANEVSQRVSSVRSRLPADAEAPVIQKFNPNAQPIMQVAIAGGGADVREVFSYADNTLKGRLERIPGVAEARISGAPARQIQVLLDPAKLAAYNLSPGRVSQAISASSLDLPAGDLTAQGSNITFATRNTPTSLPQIEQILVDGGRGIRVADLGVVRDANQTQTTFSRLNGEPVVVFSILKAAGSNTTDVAAGVRKLISETKLPQGYTATITGDTSRSISASVDDTIKEAVLVAAAVAVVCLIALGRLNTAFAVVLAIPISLAAAPIVFSFFGFTYNIITLLSMIVAMGIVVDDSIVVAENIDRYRRMGYNLLDSVLKGASEVLSAVGAATLSLLGVLIPLAFIPGVIGNFFGAFALGLAGAIFFSWLEALFFLTVRMAYTPDPEPIGWRTAGRSLRDLRGNWRWAWGLATRPWGIGLWVAWAAFQLLPLVVRRPGVAEAAAEVPLLPRLVIAVLLTLLFPLVLTLGRYLLVNLFVSLNALTATLHGWSEAGLERLKEAYGRSLQRSLGRTGWVLAGAAVFLLSGLFAAGRLGFAFTPRSDESRAQVSVVLPAGSSLGETNAAVKEIESYLLARPDVRQITTTVGAASGLTSAAAPANRATINIDLAPKGQRESVFTLMPKVQDELQARFKDRPEVEIRAGAQSDGPGGSSDLSLQLTAPNQAALEAAGQKVLAALKADPDVLNVTSSLAETAPERVFVPDQTRLAGTGLTPQDLAQTLRTANSGSRAGDFRDGDEAYDIVVRLDPQQISDEQSFLGLPVYTSALQSNLTLGDLGRFELRQAPATLYRFNKQASAQLDLNFQPGVSGFAKQRSIVQDLTRQGILDEDVTLGASSFGAAGLTGDLLLYGPIVILIALMLNYLVLGAQFNSFRYPLYLLLPVPLAIVGGLWALFFFGAGLDVITILGMVVLVGLSTKNSILLLDFVVHEARKMPLREALVSAAKLRLRPIIMTTLTVLVISFPLIFGGGEGAEFRRGLGIAILGGILASAVLTLYVVPSAFLRFEGRRSGQKAGVPAPAVAAPAASD